MIVLRQHSILPLPIIFPRFQRRHALHTSQPTPTTDPARTPKPPIDLDPALRALLNDTDISLLNARRPQHVRSHRELEVVDTVVSSVAAEEEAEEEAEEARLFPRTERKSPAASFGSRRIGAVVLPFELQRSILRLISEADKPLVHADATRLFQEENAAEEAWSTRYTPPDYTTPSAGTRMAHIKARLAKQRDGTAFASVVMPAQYAVVSAILTNAITRLGGEWARGVDRVLEWGSGTGAGMWAALHAFRSSAGADATLESSYLTSYIGIEKRDGLTSIARRLLRDVPLGGTSISLQKSLHPSDCISPSADTGTTIALTTFILSTLDTPRLRRQIVREMWDSGADVLVVIDDASSEGFRCVAEAREYLLKLSQRATETASTSTSTDTPPLGAHVVAPCPHDHPCPLQLAGGKGVRCTFEQRLQRPSFVRRTKHAGLGEEDVGYAYVVVRRGPRPGLRADSVAGMVVDAVGERKEQEDGRVGAVGRWAEEAARVKERVEEEKEAQRAKWTGAVGGSDPGVEDVVSTVEEDVTAVASPIEEDAEGEKTDDLVDPADLGAAATPVEDSEAVRVAQDQALEDSLRLEAYTWPRINFPPLKRSGHILIDACMPNGHEMRLTFPRSQGKQIFYDARKSAWGDIFPHAPKHRPVPRYVSPRADGVYAPLSREGPEGAHGRVAGGEGALAKVGQKAAGRARWGGVMDSLKRENRKRRRERRDVRDAKEMGDGGEGDGEEEEGEKVVVYM